MNVITIEQTEQVTGGFLVAVAALVAIVTLPKVVNDHRKEYNQWGHDLSQEYWDWKYPYDPNSNVCYGPNC